MSILKENLITRKALKQEYRKQLEAIHQSESDLFMTILNDLKENGEATAKAIANKYNISPHEVAGNLLCVKYSQNSIYRNPRRIVYKDFQNFTQNNKIEITKDTNKRTFVEIDLETNEIIPGRMLTFVDKRNIYKVKEK